MLYLRRTRDYYILWLFRISIDEYCECICVTWLCVANAGYSE